MIGFEDLNQISSAACFRRNWIWKIFQIFPPNNIPTNIPCSVVMTMYSLEMWLVVAFVDAQAACFFIAKRGCPFWGSFRRPLGGPVPSYAEWDWKFYLYICHRFQLNVGKYTPYIFWSTWEFCAWKFAGNTSSNHPFSGAKMLVTGSACYLQV